MSATADSEGREKQKQQEAKNIFSTLVRLMLKEEYRMMSSAIGRLGFFSFPLLITIMACVFALMSTRLPYDTAMLIVHVGIALYGLSVGSFTLLGQEMLERRLGTMTTLLTMPTMLPLKFKSVFTAFYIKDSLIYVGFTIAPLIAGLLMTVPFTGYAASSILYFLMTLTLSFMIGISFSFFLSSLYAKNRFLGVLIAAALLFAAIAGYFLAYPVTEMILPSLGLQLTKEPVFLLMSIGCIAVYSLLAYLLIEERFEMGKTKVVGSYMRERHRFRFFKENGALLAKDMIDIRRSKTQYRIMTSYVAPLVVLALMMWMFENALDVSLNFNVIGYGAIVGLVGTNIYTWINFIDDPAHLMLLPIKMSQIIKEKILMFSLLTIGIVVIYIIGASILSNSVDYLLLGLFVGLASSTYVMMCTAYLTGTHAHEYFFDMIIVGKFSALVMPPTIVLIVLSLLGELIPNVYGYISLIAALLLFISYFLFEKIEKWDAIAE